MTGLQVRELTKTYPGDVMANDGVSLEIQPGEVFGLLGPNGAGKTTLVNQIIGLLQPTSGAISIGNIDLVRHPAAARRLCSYLPQANLPIDSLPVRKAIELMGLIRGGTVSEVRRRTDSLLEALEIDQWSKKLGSQLSGGVRRLVGFIMVTVSPGWLVILDEPTNDVDPLRRRLLWEQVRQLAARGVAVLLVTHNVLEAERSVDRLAILNRGQILAQGSPGALKKSDRQRLRFDITLEPRAEAPLIPPFAGLRTQTGRRLLMHVAEAEASRALDWAHGLAREGVIEDFELGPTTLEDTYLRLIGRGGSP
jgi:ABC-2 type transport system ATP-binding protein